MFPSSVTFLTQKPATFLWLEHGGHRHRGHRGHEPHTSSSFCHNASSGICRICRSLWAWRTKVLLIVFACTGLSKRNGAKLRELSQNFPKLADWAVHWQVTLLGSTGGGNFQTGDISFARPCIWSTRRCWWRWTSPRDSAPTDPRPPRFASNFSYLIRVFVHDAYLWRHLELGALRS